jgi:hypothetical protein
VHEKKIKKKERKDLPWATTTYKYQHKKGRKKGIKGDKKGDKKENHLIFFGFSGVTCIRVP